MSIPKELLYTKDHEWVRLEADGTATVGITDFAQHALGDIVYVELPEPGTGLKAGSQAATVESVKAVSEVYCPVSGTVATVNEELADTPELLNSEPYTQWIFTLTSIADEKLLSAEEYASLIESEG
jgi:glycine cleavage system H protein